jgi:Tol biopolymer transport system component
MLMLQPAWSPDGRYVLINRWQTAPELMYNLLAYDTENRASVALITSDSPTEGGSPVAVAASFAPDGQAVGLTLNDAQADSMTFWLAVLDGSYSRVITTSSDVGDFPQGEFVVGISPDWTHSVILASEVGSPLGSLYTAALDGTQRQLLDNLVPYQFLNIGPVLSPDGLSLAYLRLEGDVNTPVANLCVINLDGSSKQVIFSGASLDQGVPGIPLVWLPEKP